MYREYYGFRNHPFSLSPDTEKFVNLHGHQECMDLLTYALSTGEGFVKIVGDVGTGKTILCRKLLRFVATPNGTESEYVAIYIPNPLLSPTGLFRTLASELGVSLDNDKSQDLVFEALNQELLSLAGQRKSVVIIIDEAQALPVATLEALRLVTNLETEKQKLVQVILFGQPELDDLLSQHQFRQLKQRITFSYYLNPLTLSSTQQYLQHRVIHAGFNGEHLFTAAAMKRIFHHSRGVPRLINVISHKALLAGFARNAPNIDKADVDTAFYDGQPLAAESRSKRIIWSISVGILVVAIAILAWMQWQGLNP